MTILTVEEAASLLKLAESTINQLCRQGRLPARKIGRLWRFDKETLENFIKQPEPQHDSIRIAARAARKIARHHELR